MAEHYAQREKTNTVRKKGISATRPGLPYRAPLQAHHRTRLLSTWGSVKTSIFRAVYKARFPPLTSGPMQRISGQCGPHGCQDSNQGLGQGHPSENCEGVMTW